MLSVTVSSTAQLVADLKAASAAEVINLAPGTYQPFALYGINPASKVTIRSGSGTQAVLTGVTLSQASNIEFDNVTFSAAQFVPPAGTAPGSAAPFSFGNVTNLRFNNDTFVGNASASWQQNSVGLSVQSYQNVSIVNSTFTHLHSGISHYVGDGLIIANDIFQYMSDDGIRGGGDKNLLIANNTFTNQHLDATDPEHPDSIQLWTVAGKTPVNINIVGNSMVRGVGSPTQGIFVQDIVGAEPFIGLNISDNVMSGTAYNGITVSNAIDVILKDNHISSYNDLSSMLQVSGVVSADVEGNSANWYFYANDGQVAIAGDVVAGASVDPIAAGGHSATPGVPSAVYYSVPLSRMPGNITVSGATLTSASATDQNNNLGPPSEGAVIVSAGQSVSDTVVSGAAFESSLLQVDSGGKTSALLVSNGADFNYGQTISTSVSDGAAEYVEAGGVSISPGLSGLAFEFVEAGGQLVSGVVGSGAQAAVYSGGMITGLTVSSGGTVIVRPGAAVSGVAVLSGGVAEYAAVVSSGVALNIGPSRITSAVTVSGMTFASGAMAVLAGAVVDSGATVMLGAGSLTSGVVDVEAGGRLAGPGALSEGADVYGSASGVALGRGAYLDVETGGSAGAINAGSGWFEVASGAVASGATVSTFYLDPGGLASATAIVSGGDGQIYGLAGGMTILSGGAATVQAGGSLSTARVDGGALLTVSSGGVESGAVIVAGGGEVVAAGGAALGDRFGSGGALSVGGVVSGAALSAGATALVAAGGVLSAASIWGSTSATSGALVSASSVSAGGVLAADAGAELVGVSVQAGGRLTGSATVGGVLVVASGGAASGVTLAPGAIDILYSGGLETATVASGSTLELVGFAPGASSSTLSASAVIDGVSVQSGASVDYVGTNAAKGGVTSVGAGETTTLSGITSGAVVLGPGSVAGTLVDAGLIEGATLDGEVTLTNGSVLSGVTIARGASAVGPGLAEGANRVSGTVSGLTVAGALTVASGGLATGDVITSGGAEAILPGGVAGSEALLSGAVLTVAAGASIGDCVVSGGAVVDGAGSVTGVLSISSGSVASGLTLASGALAIAASGAAESVIVTSGADLRLIGAMVSGEGFAGAAVRATTSSGASVSIGGVVQYADVSVASAGVLVVAGADVVSGATIASGAELVGSGAAAGDVVDGAVSDSGLVTGVTIDGRLEAAAGGLAQSLAIASGGSGVIDSGGRGASLNLAGQLLVQQGATVSRINTASGGEVIVSGLAADVSLASGATQVVVSGGEVTGETIATGAVETISAGAVSSAPTLWASGELVDSGMVEVSTSGSLNLVLSGGGALVKTGTGALALGASTTGFGGAVVVGGGDVTLQAPGAVGSGVIVFAGTGQETLTVGQGDKPVAATIWGTPIIGLNASDQAIDLSSTPFIAGANASLSGSILTLDEGGASYGFKVAGWTAQSFDVVSDGAGGSLIEPTQGSPALFIEAAAGLGGSTVAALTSAWTTPPTSAALAAPVTSG